MNNDIVEVKNKNNLKVKHKVGIVEWQVKCRIFEAVLAQGEFRSVCRLVLKPKYKDEELKDEVILADDASRKWLTSKPKRDWQQKLLVPLLELVGISDKVSLDILINGPVTTIIEALPPDKRDDAAQALASHVATNGGRIERSVEPEPACIESITRHTDTALSMTTVDAGVLSGVVESYVYYSSVQGARTWSKIIHGKTYTNFFYCMAALDELVGNSEWKKAIKAALPTSIYMLGGGGSPSKDWLMLRSILENRLDSGNRQITMTLVDINLYMLQQSRVALASLARHSKIEDKFKIRFFEDDIMSMGEPDAQRAEVLTRSGVAVFTLFGATIGNISEARFFSMLDRVAKTRDILVVGCGVLNGKSSNDVFKAEATKYRDEEVLELVRSGVDLTIRHNRLGYSTDFGVDRVKVEVWDESAMRLSDIDGSCSVVLTLETGNKSKVVLLRSTRYVEETFVHYAASHKWKLLASVSSAMNADYKQIAFQRV